MENNNKTINIYTSEQFGQVRTILNDDGSISINAEDVSIGLGWFEEKMGKKYPRWRTVNGFIKELGFSQQVAKDDYIPESLFYLLGMKASNTAAQEFQRWLAVDVLPQIRKNGSYISASSADAELDNSMGTSGLDTYGQDLSPELKAIFCIDKRTVDVTNRIKKLENNMTIDYSQQEELRTFSSKESHWRAWGQGYTSLQRTEQKGFFKHMEGL